MQNNFKHKYKKLYNHYKKLLTVITKQSLKKVSNSMEYFVTYLQFMRDYYILTVEYAKIDADVNILSLCAAISQYELYNSCIYNYYKVDKSCISRLHQEKSAEEVAKEYSNEKQKYLNSFLNIVNTHMESWFVSYDITI